MTRRLPIRRAGAAALGAALIGLGTVRYELIDWDLEPHPPPDPKPDVPQNPRRLVLPEPKFGWPAGKQANDPAQEARDALGTATGHERHNRAQLLSSASTRALLSPPAPATAPVNGAVSGEAAVLPAQTVEQADAEAPSAMPGKPDETALLCEPLPCPSFGLQPPLPSDTEIESDNGPTAIALEPVAQEQLALAGNEEPEAEASEFATVDSAPSDVESDIAPTMPAFAETTPSPPPVAATAAIATAPADPIWVANNSKSDPEPLQSALVPAPVQNAVEWETLTESARSPIRVSSSQFSDGHTDAPTYAAESFASRSSEPRRGIHTGNAAPDDDAASASNPPQSLIELVPDRSDAPPARLALASAIPTGTTAGPTEASMLTTQIELDPATALAKANERSLLNFASGPPAFTYEEELILDVQVKGVDASDTIFAYGTREGVFLPLGTFARILDLAIVVSDEGHYASGWTLDERRTLTLDLRNDVAIIQGQKQSLPRDSAAAFDGEMYLRSDVFRRLLPLDVQIDLRLQRILLVTLEPFPFQEKARREANRAKLAARLSQEKLRWPREETPWRLFSTPLVDLEMRALSDRGRGERLEGDVRMAGDLGYLTAEALLSADTRDGLTTSLITLGRTDPDADLLGPLQATNFAFGDISTVSMPIGLRGVAGRGLTLTNNPPQSVSVFENIDLRGILPDGYEVELYRNDVLIGSTAEAINGQYEFLQVPVDFGLNVLRLVFYGPQGQRSEQVRRITVGDGRLARGKLVYRLGAVQKDENLLGVRDPFYQPPDDLGAWRTIGELAYGLTSDITAIASGAWFETPDDDKWLFSSGIRSGIGRFAVRSDITFGDGGSWAAGAGAGGRFGDSTFTLDHTEYSGDFIDETKSIGREFLKRSTELDFNTTLRLGNPTSGLIIPLTARFRRFESQAGREQTTASLRASTHLSSVLASNTLEYSRTSFPQANALSQLFGNFDLSTLSRSKLRGRLSLSYQVLPEPDLLSTSFEASYLSDGRTSMRARVGYSFKGRSTQVGASAVREFDRFTLSLDGNYGFSGENYSVGLRFATSFGRNPQNGRFFVTRPGLASMGAASMRAFQDLDGDGLYSNADRALPGVEFVAFNQSAKTDEDGIALLDGLGNGQRVNLQIDRSSLPDIALAPAIGGVEIVPRPGRVHSGDFAIVALSEIEGQVDFAYASGARGVSGVRLQLRNAKGEVISHTRSEVDGYYFFEEVKPGQYDIVIDQDQAQRLRLCLATPHHVEVGYESDIYQEPILITSCQ